MNNKEPYSQITPRDNKMEIGIQTNFYIKLNEKQHIDYVNTDFCNVTGYEDYELIDELFTLIYHPDMPNVLNEILFDLVNKKEKVELIMKMIA